MEGKLQNLLDKYDLWAAGVLPEHRTDGALKKIAKIWLKEVAHLKKQEPKYTEFKLYLTHPIEMRWMFKENEWCLYPFTNYFKYDAIHKPLTTLMWTKFKKHPAYAVPQMTAEEQQEILEGIIQYLRRYKESIELEHLTETFYVKGREETRQGILLKL